jgi:hypothetical protein
MQSQYCDIAVRLSSFGVAVVVAAAGVIFSYRVVALWKGNKLVYAILGLAYAATIGCWVGELIYVLLRQLNHSSSIVHDRVNLQS